MRTTTETGRRGDALDAEDWKQSGQQARKLLAFANSDFERELTAYRVASETTGDPVTLKSVKERLTELKKVLQLVIETRTKAIAAGVSEKVELDLEAARAEVESRLARLA